ncbi:hypothetical protein MHU86_19022 [Fragilaria crotonensis]|nr:hypothetical protein MHU86_19022 [Fragilaria crotonensis]
MKLSHNPVINMASIRRLSDDDVRAIFECVHNNTNAPSHLPFQIVPVGTDGLKLSPPSFQFDDGLYILLKPLQKKKYTCFRSAQGSFQVNGLSYAKRSETNCPWSLSGPQFPQPTAIQQRYCYRRRPHVQQPKGGALWTMYGTDGREDLEYRLLHVYFSAKRAVNKGVRFKPVGPRTIHASVQSTTDFDAFQLDMDDQCIEEDSYCWEDPAVPNACGNSHDSSSRIFHFAAKMEQIHESIKECIMNAAQDSEQAHLVSLVSSWAKQVAASPLGAAEIAIEEL